MSIYVHEAGHAVAARTLGLRVARIAFYSGKDPQATCYHADAARTVVDEATILYAGIAAGYRVMSRERAMLIGWDDLDKFEQLLKTHEERAEVKARAVALIDARWDEVERLAAELERRGGLDTDELQVLGFWWPKP